MTGRKKEGRSTAVLQIVGSPGPSRCVVQ